MFGRIKFRLSDFEMELRTAINIKGMRSPGSQAARHEACHSPKSLLYSPGRNSGLIHIHFTGQRAYVCKKQGSGMPKDAGIRHSHQNSDR